MKRSIDIEVVCRTADVIGESPVWSVREQVLYWLDVRNSRLMRVRPGREPETWPVEGALGAIGLHRDGGFVLARDDGFFTLRLEPGGIETGLIARPVLPDPTNRLKEGKCDRRGRFWCGSKGSSAERADGALFRLDADGACTQVDHGFIVPNGLAFSPDDRTLMMADTRAEKLFAYDLDLDSGTIANRRVFFSTAEFPGYIDGATFDADGGYWCAMIHDWAIARFDPHGRLDRLVRLPVRHPTMCSFGGPDLDVLYVTTATAFLAEGEAAAQLLAGSLFAIHGLGVQGLPEPLYG